jgi:hypothetical protein
MVSVRRVSLKSNHFSWAPSSDARRVEAGSIRPVAKLRGITANANKHAVGRRRPIQNEQLVPPGRRDLRIRRRGDRADGASAQKLGEDDAAAHSVAMCAGHRPNERDA